jgi:hypothetical protein
MDAAQFKLQAEVLQSLDMLVADLPPAPEIWPEKSSANQSSM